MLTIGSMHLKRRMIPSLISLFIVFDVRAAESMVPKPVHVLATSTGDRVCSQPTFQSEFALQVDAEVLIFCRWDSSERLISMRGFDVLG